MHYDFYYYYKQPYILNSLRKRKHHMCSHFLYTKINLLVFNNEILAKIV